MQVDESIYNFHFDKMCSLAETALNSSGRVALWQKYKVSESKETKWTTCAA